MTPIKWWVLWAILYCVWQATSAALCSQETKEETPRLIHRDYGEERKKQNSTLDCTQWSSPCSMGSQKTNSGKKCQRMAMSCPIHMPFAKMARIHMFSGASLDTIEGLNFCLPAKTPWTRHHKNKSLQGGAKRWRKALSKAGSPRSRTMQWGSTTGPSMEFMHALHERPSTWKPNMKKSRWSGKLQCQPLRTETTVSFLSLLFALTHRRG